MPLEIAANRSFVAVCSLPVYTIAQEVNVERTENFRIVNSRRFGCVIRVACHAQLSVSLPGRSHPAQVGLARCTFLIAELGRSMLTLSRFVITYGGTRHLDTVTTPLASVEVFHVVATQLVQRCLCALSMTLPVSILMQPKSAPCTVALLRNAAASILRCSLPITCCCNGLSVAHFLALGMPDCFCCAFKHAMYEERVPGVLPHLLITTINRHEGSTSLA